MQKIEILDRVLAFCDVRGDTFLWRNEPFRSELFALFQESHCGPAVSGDEIMAHVRCHMEPAGRWHVPMQERVADICTAWDDWDYAAQQLLETVDNR
ncbi:MAG TPA: hypothetical protein VHD36_06310 [Pirellulales bacterium]|nr:hypothetical protein [Pirellulales bacterium]